MSFQVGQRVVCVTDGVWRNEDFQLRPGPSRGDVLEIEIMATHFDTIYLGFAAHLPSVYQADHFRPLTDSAMDLLRAIAANPGHPLPPAVEGPRLPVPLPMEAESHG